MIFNMEATQKLLMKPWGRFCRYKEPSSKTRPSFRRDPVTEEHVEILQQLGCRGARVLAWPWGIALCTDYILAGY